MLQMIADGDTLLAYYEAVIDTAPREDLRPALPANFVLDESDNVMVELLVGRQ
jgi:hypothetical protein